MSVVNLPACVIEVGHPAGTPATWFNPEYPWHAVCDRHKGYYETAYDDYSGIKWRRIVDYPCSGSSACDAPLHVHGCYADLGRCDAPSEHTGKKAPTSRRRDVTDREALLRCEHGLRVPCTVCDPYIASRAIAEGGPVSTPPARCPHAHPVRNLKGEVVPCPACGTGES